MTATPLSFSVLVTLSLSLFPSRSFHRFHQAFLFYVRSFSPRLSTSHFEAIVTLRYDCSTFDRSQVADDYKTIRVYAITSADRKRHRNGESFHPFHSTLLLFFTTAFFQPLMERSYREKWEQIFFEKRKTNFLHGFSIFWVFSLFLNFLVTCLLSFFNFLVAWFLDSLVS